MLVVTHELGFARNVSNRVAFMENGVIVEEGSSTSGIFRPSEGRRAPARFLRKIDGDMSAQGEHISINNQKARQNYA